MYLIAELQGIAQQVTVRLTNLVVRPTPYHRHSARLYHLHMLNVSREMDSVSMFEPHGTPVTMHSEFNLSKPTSHTDHRKSEAERVSQRTLNVRR